MPYSSPVMATPKPSYTFDELQWVVRIRRTIEEEMEDEDNYSACIFVVPKSLKSSKPEAYIPQQLALGPYHSWRPELFDMERYKLAAAKRNQKQLQHIKFQHLVEQFLKMELRIRACYHKYLDLNHETLAWMMAVDVSFLLEFLQIFSNREGTSSRTSHLVDSAGAKSSCNTILRDIFMLENQIPLFILRKMIEFQHSNNESATEALYVMVMCLCDEVSPFSITGDFISSHVKGSAHLLEFLYFTIIPKLEESPQIVEDGDAMGPTKKDAESFKNSSHVKQFITEVWNLLSRLNKGPISFVNAAMLSKPVKFVKKLPWKFITMLPGFALLKQPVEYFMFSKQESVRVENEGSSRLKKNSKPPLIEEIKIPSVTELAKAGFHFVPSVGDITTIQFDKKTSALHLPTVSLDVNTEVILRNLVAYETSMGTSQLAFTRYTELMNAIIDTEEDAKLLREKGVVLNHLKSDLEVANLWNGMSQSVKLTTVPFLDVVIEDVNKHYNGRWKVKLRQFMKVYVFASWQFLTLVAVVFLFLLMSLQAFCSVYRCGRLGRINTSNGDGA
ncbi:hypothetical protein Syun_025538 [Stephania yunnanensis]|uniref:Uncharacterized protein n=1 Tax=Stephania yunnanensis TaxID=152371 RepID=A0AAP0EXE3_9MAGN